MMRLEKAKRLRTVVGPLIVMLLFLLSSFATVQAKDGVSSSTQYADHGFAALAAGDRVTLSTLTSLTGGNLSVTAFKQVIQETFLPLNIRSVLLDIGWQNFTAGSPPYQAWVSNWLTACDAMGISNVLYVGQLTADGFGSPWVESLIAKDPTVATYYSNGTRVNFVSLDDPEVARYIEDDLAVLYSYYGMHVSWTGLGTGSSADNPYYASGETMPTIGYSNLSISNFVSSPYYEADVNGTGYLPNGTLDALWSTYRNVQPGIVLSSVLWETSSSTQVYGSGADASFVEMRFQIPTNTHVVQIGWYGDEVGNPGDLNVVIHGDDNGSLDTSVILDNVSVSASSFNSSVGWQNGIEANGNFSAGYYWAVFSSHSSDGSNYYDIYMKDYNTNGFPAYAAQLYNGIGLLGGSTILWLKNAAGQNLEIYPYQEAAIGAPSQLITANHVFTFNTVFLFLSDRAFNTVNATLTITDMTEGNETVATGLLSQALVHGVQNWYPVSLNGSVTTVTGHRYLLTINDPSITWSTVMRYVNTNPPEAGFQNQSATLIFELGDADWSQGQLQFTALGSNGADSVASGVMDAVRFTPSSNETLKSIQILMVNNGQAEGNYTSGTLTVAAWGSAPGGSAPQGPALQQIEVAGTRVPNNGLLNVTGFATPLIAGEQYWIVFSTNSTEQFSLGRLSSAYAYLVLASRDGGATWGVPSEGPTDYAFTITLSKQVLGTFIQNMVTTPLTTNSLFAQSFVAVSNTAAEGIYLGPITSGPPLLISINPTGADDQPSVSTLASGILNAGNITLDYGPEFVQFSSIAHLQKGQEYWIVIHPLNMSYKVSSLVYLGSAPNVPKNSSTVVSNDNGLIWKDISNTTSTLPVYLIETPPIGVPELDTQEQFNSLATNQNFPVSSGPLRGWNAYVQASELSISNAFTQWLNNDTGRTFEFYTDAQVNVVNQLNLKAVVVLPMNSSTLTCGGLLADEQSEIAAGGGRYSYGNISLLQQCATEGIATLAQQLNYAPYVGGQFGLSTPTKVLVVGDTNDTEIAAYLSNAFNTSFVNFNLNPSLNVQGALSSFRAVVWLPGDSEPVSASVLGLLDRYVRGGGELITTNPDLANLSVTGATAAEAQKPAVLNGSSFLRAAFAHTLYANESFQTSITSSTVTARSSDLVLSAKASGLGRVVFLDYGSAIDNQISDQVVLVSNIVSTTIGAQSAFWYAQNDSQAPTLSYSVEGTRGGPLLVWLYNPSSSASAITINLNGTYYGVPSAWKTVDTTGPSATVGSGSDVRIQTVMPPQSLRAIYVVSQNEPLIDFSSALVERQFAYPDQSLYDIAGTENQSVLVMISSNASASQILLNDSTTLPQMSSMSGFNNATAAWYFDSQSSSLFVKYQSSGYNSLRFDFYALPAPPPYVLPVRTIVIELVFLIAIEVTIFTYLAFNNRHRGIRPKGAADATG